MGFLLMKKRSTSLFSFLSYFAGYYIWKGRFAPFCFANILQKSKNSKYESWKINIVCQIII